MRAMSFEFPMGDAEEEKPKLAPDILAVRLRDSLKQFQEKHTFSVGQIVRQKPQASSYRWPNSLAIVVEILAEPTRNDDAEPGNTHYREPLDIIVGIIDESDGEFMLFYVDSRRLEPVDDVAEV